MMCSLTLRQYLQDNFGFSDLRAGVAYGMWGLLITIYGLLLGPVVDKVGVRHSLITGACLMGASRFWLALTLSEEIMLFNLYVLLPIGISLGQPVKMIGVRRYTAGVTGGFVWCSVFFAMNLGFSISGVVVDVFREQFPKRVHYDLVNQTGQLLLVPGSNTSVLLPAADNSSGTAIAKVVLNATGHRLVQSNVPHQAISVWSQMTSYRWLHFASGVVTCVMLLVALVFVTDDELVWIRKGKQGGIVRGINIKTEQDLDDLGIVPKEEAGDDASSDEGSTGGHFALQPYKFKPKATVCEMISSLNVRQVWIFILLVFCTMFIRMLFRHLDVTFPEYAEREMGEDIKLGAIITANPISTIVFTSIIAIWFSSLPLMETVITGMTIMSLSCAWLFVKPTYSTTVAFAVTMALGEALWAPRFLELSISISAPDGQEGLFTALVNAPMFLVKFFAGIFSGYLLDRYVPESGPRNSTLMWFIIFLTSVASPLLIGILHYCCNVWEPLFSRVANADEKKLSESPPKDYDDDAEQAARQPLLGREEVSEEGMS